jgi:penicillin-binding protein 1C
VTRSRPRTLAVLILAVAGAAVLGAATFAGDWPMGRLGYEEVASLVVEDRHGVPLTERPGQQPGDVAAHAGREAERPSGRLRPTPLAQISPWLIKAVVAAEDRRFYYHHGIDVAALGHAALENLAARRVRRGASTLTQQLVRALHPRPRGSLRGKLREWLGAWRLEARLGKSTILEAYLNRVHFGHGTYGVTAAAARYFGKAPIHLSLAEAASLAALLRSPVRYDPEQRPRYLKQRRDLILGMMGRLGLAGADEVQRARQEPLDVREPVLAFRAPHFVAWALGETGLPERALAAGTRLGRVRTTLDWRLQELAQGALRRVLAGLAQAGATNGSVVVLDVPTGEVLAYVGSVDYFDAKNAGQVDGARARRSPGSALKPFAYALAFEHGDAPSTVVADVPVHYDTPTGDYAPRNYDGRFHGPVSLRTALACSYNIPAVRLVERHGVTTLHRRLQQLGLTTLEEDAAHYGLGLILGDAEVRLLELTSAYAALARGGVVRRPRGLLGALDVAGRRLPLDDAPAATIEPSHPDRQVFPRAAVALVSDVLRDPLARRPAFGAQSALELDVPVAVKTGTSKDHRDVWTVGYTPEVAVGVWVGDMRGRPMSGLSGVAGAAPVWNEVMTAALAGRAPRWPEERELSTATVCARSGLLPTPDCPRVQDRFAVPHGGGPAGPGARCPVHRGFLVDDRDGSLIGADDAPGRARAEACPEAQPRRQVFEVWGGELLRWARAAGLPGVPETSSRCAARRPAVATAGRTPGTRPTLRILQPVEGDRFALDATRPGMEQRVWLHADLDGLPPGTFAQVEWRIDGSRIAQVGPPYATSWPLRPGRHTAEALALGTRQTVHFSVK